AQGNVPVVRVAGVGWIEIFQADEFVEPQYGNDVGPAIEGRMERMQADRAIALGLKVTRQRGSASRGKPAVRIEPVHTQLALAQPGKKCELATDRVRSPGGYLRITVHDRFRAKAIELLQDIRP